MHILLKNPDGKSYNLIVTTPVFLEKFYISGTIVQAERLSFVVPVSKIAIQTLDPCSEYRV